MKRILKLILCVNLFMFMTTASWAYRISPTIFDERIDGSGSIKEFTLYNDGNETVRYSVNVFKNDGDPVEKGDMTPWTKVFPKVVTIRPKSQGKVKVSVQAPKGLAEGNYNTILAIRTLKVPQINAEQGVGISVGVAIPINLNILLRGQVGDASSKIKVTETKIRKEGNIAYVEAKIDSEFDGAYPLEMSIGVEKGGTRRIDLGRIPPKGSREISFPVNLDEHGSVKWFEIKKTDDYTKILYTDK